MLLTLDEFELIKDRLDLEMVREIAREVKLSSEEVARFFKVPANGRKDVFVVNGIHGSYVRLDEPAIFEAACRYVNAFAAPDYFCLDTAGEVCP